MTKSQLEARPSMVYRYFREEKYADLMVSGAFRLSTLAACRAHEDAEQGDPGEGTQAYHSGTIRGGSDDPAFVEQARRSGISVGAGCSEISIDNCVSHNTVPDAYLLCTSRYRDDDYFSRSFGAYCVEIVSPAMALWHITNMLVALGKSQQGACAPVRYRERVYKGLEEMEHPVFVKPAIPYAPQREFRFAWIPQAPLTGPLDIVVPNLSHYCRRVL